MFIGKLVSIGGVSPCAIFFLTTTVSPIEEYV